MTTCSGRTGLKPVKNTRNDATLREACHGSQRVSGVMSTRVHTTRAINSPRKKPKTMPIRRSAPLNTELRIIWVNNQVNSAQAMSGTGRVRVSLALDGQATCRVDVADEGPGIARRILAGMEALMKRDGFATIAEAVGSPEASVSARLRDLRKPAFGGHTVERQYVERGLFRYRVVR